MKKVCQIIIEEPEIRKILREYVEKETGKCVLKMDFEIDFVGSFTIGNFEHVIKNVTLELNDLTD